MPGMRGKAARTHYDMLQYGQLLTCDEAHTNDFVLLAANLRDHALCYRHQAVHRTEHEPDDIVVTLPLSRLPW